MFSCKKSMLFSAQHSPELLTFCNLYQCSDKRFFPSWKPLFYLWRLLWAVSLSESLRDRNYSEILQTAFSFSCSIQDCRVSFFSLERSLDLEKHLHPRKVESCCLPHCTGWGWLSSAAAFLLGLGRQDRETLRKGEGQMELLLLVPDLLQALEIRLTEVWSKAAPLGVGAVS